MARAYTLLLSLVALTLLVPAIHAQNTVAITKIKLIDAQGEELRIVPKDGFVTIQVTVNNTGSTTIQGTLTLNLTIEAVDGSCSRTANVNRPGPVTPGNETVFTYSWAPSGRTTGDYRVTARMLVPSASEGLVATFDVADTGVASGNIVERILSFYWVLGLAVAALVVFFVVLAARRS
jgi:uncharacterized BrkB/YihY/UPF0761 family membrane protein